MASVLHIRLAGTEEPVVTIFNDGTVRFGPDCTDEKATKAFWIYCASQNPLYEGYKIAMESLAEIAEWEATHNQKLYSNVAHNMSKVAADAMKKIREA